MARVVSQHPRLLGLGGIVVDVQEGPPLSQTAKTSCNVFEALRLPHSMLQLRKNFTFDGASRQVQVDRVWVTSDGDDVAMREQ